MDPRPWLLAAGWCSVAASLLHVATVFGGGDWYRFFGAGEAIARAAERGSATPVIVTLVIALILAGWALYAFGAAGTIPRMPLMRTALVAISAVLLARGLMVFVPALWAPELSFAFRLWSSLICLAMGLCFAIGTWLAWPALSQPRIAS